MLKTGRTVNPKANLITFFMVTVNFKVCVLHLKLIILVATVINRKGS